LCFAAVTMALTRTCSPVRTAIYNYI
jgi:hypothetical protein